jgi:hypothetical protein
LGTVYVVGGDQAQPNHTLVSVARFFMFGATRLAHLLFHNNTL